MSDKNNTSEKQEQIKEFGAVSAFSGKHKIYCLTIIGEIEGHSVLPEQSKTTKYEHIIPQLVAVEESQDIEGLLIILNTVGGDVEAGLALAELISGLKKPTVSFVLGGGHSIGVPLAVSAKKSFIAPSATMTVHPVRTNGLVIGVPQMFNHFARMQERITDFVVRNSKIQKDDFTALMMNTGEMVTDVGSVLSGEKAVATGLIDAVGTLSDVLDELYNLIES
ncbi:MAG: ATP-dependent Clp protease proteolytic subunit [Clostridia bacterium]|nr:ATP-dependent Clp protease proteolytic subunit [Clostridia bacterium]